MGEAVIDGLCQSEQSLDPSSVRSDHPSVTINPPGTESPQERNPEDIAAFITLSDQSERKLEARRSLQWKLKLGLWVAMPTIAYHVLAESKLEELRCGAGLLFVLFVILDFFWTESMQRSHAIDQAFHLYYRHKANHLLGVEDHAEGDRNRYPVVNDMKTSPMKASDRRWAILLWLPTLAIAAIYFIAMSAIGRKAPHGG